jgi:hypothetical protein
MATNGSDSDILATILSLSPLFIAPVFALVVAAVSGPGSTTAVNQGAMLTRLLSLLVYPLLAVVPVYVAGHIASPSKRGTILGIGFAAWLTSPVPLYLVLAIVP